MQSAFKIGVLCSNSPLYNHFNISSVKSKIIIHNMSLLCQRFVQKEFRIFMKIESHVYRNEICLTALFIPSCANAFKPNHSKWWRITSKIIYNKGNKIYDQPHWEKNGILPKSHTYKEAGAATRIVIREWALIFEMFSSSDIGNSEIK